MLFKRKIVNVRPQRIVTPTAPQQTVHHETVVEKHGWSPEATAMAIIAGLVLFAMLLYFMWYRPAQETVVSPGVVERNTIIERQAPEPSMIVTPPPIITPPESNPIIVNPPVQEPPITIENNVPERPITEDPVDAPPVVPGD